MSAAATPVIGLEWLADGTVGLLTRHHAGTLRSFRGEKESSGLTHV